MPDPSKSDTTTSPESSSPQSSAPESSAPESPEAADAAPGTASNAAVPAETPDGSASPSAKASETEGVGAPAPEGARDVPAPAPEAARPGLRPGSTTAQPLPHVPDDGEAVEEASVAFEWTPVDAATNYELQIATDTDFENLLFDGRVGDEPHFTFSGLPPYEGLTIYWRVRAEADGTWGDFGPAGHFDLRDWRHEPIFEDEPGADEGVAPVATQDNESRSVALFMILTILVSIGGLALLFLSLQDWEGGWIPTAEREVTEVQGQDLDASGVTPSEYEELEEGRWQIPVDSAMAIIATERTPAAEGSAVEQAQEQVSDDVPATAEDTSATQ